MSSSIASELARRLAQDAEAVCRHYLSNGRRHGRYWIVGDARNAPGRSLFVRLTGPESGKGAAGNWTDAALGDYGDLLDIIRQSVGLNDFSEVLDEARRFLSLPRDESQPQQAFDRNERKAGSPGSARRLFAMSRPIAGTLAERYLHHRGISARQDLESLRFHPRCYYRSENGSASETWPAMIAAVTNLEGQITGAHRTWLDRTGCDKAPIASPRRAMGKLLGNGVRFGAPLDVMAAGEGIETVLSVRCLLPGMPMIAALSSAHLAAILFPDGLRRLYVLRDNDPAGERASATLLDRATAEGIEAVVLAPALGDFNDDLRRIGAQGLHAALRGRLAPQDVDRFMRLSP
ncbi:MAG: DNA primase [Hyphomicrobiales bacterium]|nr:MAG: DNA primase [Hyphomicrobiales bacterium]